MKAARKTSLASGSLIAGLILAPAFAPAAEPKPSPSKPARSKLDDELLEGLGDPAEDEALPGKPAQKSAGKAAPGEAEAKAKPPAAKGKAKDKKPTRGGDLDDELLEGLGDGEDIELNGKPGAAAGGEASDNPFVDLGRQMREVESRIAQAQSDEETQKLQHKIASEIEKLVKQLQQRKKSSPSSSSSNKNQQTAKREKVNQPETAKAGQQAAGDAPAKESTETLRDRRSEKPATAQMDEALKDIWGQLPAHLRQQMEQYAKEELLPKYELQIEEYFRALAEGQRDRP